MKTPAMGLVVAVVLFSSCADELPVDVFQEGEELSVAIDTSFLGLDSLMVGRSEFLFLDVSLGSALLTGLRVRWLPLDSTALAVESAADSYIDIFKGTATKADSLDATLFGEVSALRRGTSSIRVFVDSAGSDDVLFEEVTIPVKERWQSVSAGFGHTCAVTFAKGVQLPVPQTGPTLWHRLREGGEVFCWGQGVYGALGTGSAEQTLTPRQAATEVSFREISSGLNYTCGRDGVGLLHCWGDNIEGQLGLGNELDQFVPRLTALAVAFGPFDVGKASQFTCAVLKQSLKFENNMPTEPGGTLCWGQNDLGQLGCGMDEDTCEPEGLTQPNTADEVQVIDADSRAPEFVSLSVGGHHACGVEEDGTALCWGSDSHGQLGATVEVDECGNPAQPCSRFAVTVGGTLKFAEIAAGLSFTCGIVADRSTLVCWGLPPGSCPSLQSRREGTCGAGQVAVAVDVPGTLASLNAGAGHACALNDVGDAFCWGENDSGQLGDNTVMTQTEARPVSGGLTFGVISAGFSHTCGITVTPFELQGSPVNLPNSGGLYCWGDNPVGELGNGTTINSSIPVRVLLPGAILPLTQPAGQAPR